MKQGIFILLTIVCFGLVSNVVVAEEGHDHGHSHGHDEHEEPAKGPEGGRLLSTDDFAIEVTIFEAGVPPQFRLFAYDDENPVKPQEVKARIELKRFGKRSDSITFTPEAGYLVSAQTVDEPHSFEASVSAEYKGKSYSWEYDSFEGRTELSHAAIKAANLQIAIAGKKRIERSIDVYGKLMPREDKVAHITPRFPGVIREIRKGLGDLVQKGEVLAEVESNQSLQPYEIRSQIAGVVIERHATLGEFVSDSRDCFVVADLSELWADFQIYRDDFQQVSLGQKLQVIIGDGILPIETTVSYISPLTDEATQSKIIRALVSNQSLMLRPGLFVTGKLTLSSTEVNVAVKRSALQTFRDWDVVFLTDGHVFQAMPVELGQVDEEYAEVLSGIASGEQYVSENSFIVKADIEKSGASHDH